MTEDEQFYEMEMRQRRRDLENVAREAGKKFCHSHGKEVTGLTVKEIYELGYLHAMIDIKVRGINVP